MDRRLNPKRPSRNPERNPEKATTSQTNADLGVQGTIDEWRVQQVGEVTRGVLQSPSPSTQDDGTKTALGSPSDLPTVAPPEGEAPGPDGPAQVPVLPGATDQDKVVPGGLDECESDGTSSAVGQKLPISEVPQQAISAFGHTNPSSPTSPASTETAGIQASTTSGDSQNALGTTVANVSDTMKSNNSSELPSRSLGKAQPRGTVDKASPVTNREAVASATLRESSRFTPSEVAMLDPRLTASTAAVDELPQNTRGAILDTVLHGISDQVLEFKRLGADSMAVLLKPDDKTEIYLSIKSLSGHLEVSAPAEHGRCGSVEQPLG